MILKKYVEQLTNTIAKNSPVAIRVSKEEAKPDIHLTSETKGLVKDTGDIPKMKNEVISSLDIWEAENRRPYIQDYFNIREIAHTFPLSANYKYINKHINNEIDRLGYERNIENFSEVLSNIEKEIGSEKLEVFKRIQKIFNYINIIKKYNKIKEKKESYGIY